MSVLSRRSETQLFGPGHNRAAAKGYRRKNGLWAGSTCRGRSRQREAAGLGEGATAQVVGQLWLQKSSERRKSLEIIQGQQDPEDRAAGCRVSGQPELQRLVGRSVGQVGEGT